MAGKFFKTFVPAIYRAIRVIQFTRARVEIGQTTFEGAANMNIKPEIRDDGVVFNVQAECHANLKQEINVCGRTLEVSASGNGQFDGKVHIALKEK